MNSPTDRDLWWSRPFSFAVGLPLSLLVFIGFAALTASFEAGPAEQQAVFEKLVLGQPVLLLLGLTLFTPFERLFPRRRQRFLRAELRTDLAHILLSPIIGAALSVGLFTGIEALLSGSAAGRSRPLSAGPLEAMPAWLVLVLAVVLEDFLKFAQHLLAHRIPLLWRFHSIHHSSKTMDWFAGERFHPIDAVWSSTFRTLPFALLGFTVYEFVAVRIVVALVDLFNHANVKWRFRWLGPVLVTPEYHHWHHVDRPEAYNTNFASLLPLWDILFGTYRLPGDRCPGDYGLPRDLPDSYLAHMVQPLLPSWSPEGPTAPEPVRPVATDPITASGCEASLPALSRPHSGTIWRPSAP